VLLVSSSFGDKSQPHDSPTIFFFCVILGQKLIYYFASNAKLGPDV
jgi:hypothetical protein